jgi:uncharacterized protein YjiS (DUF1127 family)
MNEMTASAARRFDGVRRAGSGMPGQLLGWLFACSQRARQRRQLAELEPRFWQDIGVTRTAVREEVEKPFWR